MTFPRVKGLEKSLQMHTYGLKASPNRVNGARSQRSISKLNNTMYTYHRTINKIPASSSIQEEHKSKVLCCLGT